MKNLIVALLLLATWAYVVAAVGALFGVFPFPAIAWTGLILIAAWAAYDYFNERGGYAHRTGQLV